MNNEPIYGCQTCNTTVGRNGCLEHRDKPKILIADIPNATLEISIRDAKITELKAALTEAREDSKRLLALYQIADVFRTGMIVIQLPLAKEAQWDGVTAYWDEDKFRAAIDAARKAKP